MLLGPQPSILQLGLQKGVVIDCRKNNTHQKHKYLILSLKLICIMEFMSSTTFQDVS